MNAPTVHASHAAAVSLATASASAPTPAPRAQALGIMGCHACGLAVRVAAAAQRTAAGDHQGPDGDPATCPRCGARLHRRKPASAARTMALLIAAAIAYVPANVLPVMNTTGIGGSVDSTILEGVVDFWRTGDWDIALIIFIASVAVPCGKFMLLGYLLWASRAGAPAARDQVRRDRSRLYRVVEFVGYWSMLDVVVVALVAAAVQFGQLSSVEPRVGIAYFGAVVVLTMLAAQSFDPRTIWDRSDPASRPLTQSDPGREVLR